jgi:hypothetical protein
MHHDINTKKSAAEAFFVANVTEEVTHVRSVHTARLHLKLLKLVPAEDYQFLGRIVSQYDLGKFLAEASGPACDENCLL